MSFRKPNGKERFIIMMAQGILNKGPYPISEQQFRDAKALFLAKAYDATPAVIQKFTDKLKGVVHGQPE